MRALIVVGKVLAAHADELRAALASLVSTVAKVGA
jgi:hypothetical protein